MFIYCVNKTLIFDKIYGKLFLLNQIKRFGQAKEKNIENGVVR